MRLEYFQLLSRIEEVDKDPPRLRASSIIPTESTIFEGHFPGYPLMPGVLLIESMAQASGHLILALNDYSLMPFLAEVRTAKLRNFVPPGSHIEIEATLAHTGSIYAVAHAKVRQGDKRIAEAEIRFRLMPFPSDAMRAVMVDLAERLGLPRSALGTEGA